MRLFSIFTQQHTTINDGCQYLWKPTLARAATMQFLGSGSACSDPPITFAYHRVRRILPPLRAYEPASRDPRFRLLLPAVALRHSDGAVSNPRTASSSDEEGNIRRTAASSG